MAEEAVRQAYASVVDRYAEMFDRPLPETPADRALVERHLVGLDGPVLDAGCGPGHWTAYLHAAGAQVSGLDLVPDFVRHARAAHPGPAFRGGSMLEPVEPDGSLAGVLSWYSTIHLPPEDVDRALSVFRRGLRPGGVLVLGFFGSDDGVQPFDHAVAPAWRWPVDVLSQRLGGVGLQEVDRLRYELAHRPDRRYAALAARAI